MNLKEYTNDALVEKMCNEENLQLLDNILSREEAILDPLKNVIPANEKEHDNKELEGMLLEVKSYVDNFLGIKDIGPCKIRRKNFAASILDSAPLALSGSLLYSLIIRYGTDFDLRALIDLNPNLLFLINIVTSFIPFASVLALDEFKIGTAYRRTSERIYIVNEQKRTSLIPAIAHEYTHHAYTKSKLPISRRLRALEEGLARGVEMQIAKEYARKEQNPYFLAEATYVAYIDLTVFSDKISKRMSSPGNSKDFDDLDFHEIGTAYMMLEEAKKGPGVYKEMFRELAEAKEF